MSARDASADAPEALLLMIRHGETEWNAASRIQGQLDTGLSELGRRQAQALAEHLRGTALDAVYASDLARARDTAAPLARQAARELALDARLRERAFGIFEGSTYAEAQARWPHEYAIWQRREPAHAVPGGESYLDMRARILQFLDEIAVRHPAGTVAVVTHGGALDIVYRHAHGIAWEIPRSHLLPNACVNRVGLRRLEDGTGAPARLALAVRSWAESGHLAGLRDELA